MEKRNRSCRLVESVLPVAPERLVEKTKCVARPYNINVVQRNTTRITRRNRYIRRSSDDLNLSRKEATNNLFVPLMYIGLVRRYRKSYFFPPLPPVLGLPESFGFNNRPTG